MLNQITKQILRARGFTLIEVMASLAVFAIAASGLYTINQQNILMADRLESKSIANWVALNAFNEMHLEAVPSSGTSKEKVEMAGQDWSVEAEVLETPLTSIKRITISVFDASGQRHAQLDGFIGEKTVKDLNAY